jgi:hypothetical protein
VGSVVFVESSGRAVVNGRKQELAIGILDVERRVEPQILTFGLSEHVFDTVEQVPFVLLLRMWPGFEFLFGKHLGQLFEQVALLFVEFLRRLNLNRREQIAATAAADGRHPFAA